MDEEHVKKLKELLVGIIIKYQRTLSSWESHCHRLKDGTCNCEYMSSWEQPRCPHCGWVKCPECNACRPDCPYNGKSIYECPINELLDSVGPLLDWVEFIWPKGYKELAVDNWTGRHELRKVDRQGLDWVQPIKDSQSKGEIEYD